MSEGAPERPVGLAIKAASALVTAYLHLVYFTSRFTYDNRAAFERFATARTPFIIVFWHGRMMGMPHICQPIRGARMLVSAHKDGEFIARVITAHGFPCIRGSTARQKPGQAKAKDKGGAQALRQMVRILKDGGVVGITPDGPRGPRMRVSTGTIVLAQLAGVPLLPLSTAMRPAFVFGSWDRFFVPLPFARFHVTFGEPVSVPREMDEAEFERQRGALEETLNALTRQCDETLGKPAIEPGPALARGIEP